MHVAVIPARSGSRGVEHKNVLPLWGISLIGWAALTARATGLFDCILLSTDSPEYAQEGDRYGCVVPFLRPPALAGDNASINTVLLDLIENTPGSEEWETITLLEPTSPLRTPEIISQCHRLITHQPGTVNTAITLMELPYSYHAAKQLVMDDAGQVSFSHPDGPGVNNRQVLQPAYVRNGMAYIIRRDSFLQSQNIMHGVIRGVMVEHPVINIDHPNDVKALRNFEAHHSLPDWCLPFIRSGQEVPACGSSSTP
jgi:CMP-N,N'-diacetyllegionaminic acid synthase